MKQSVALTGRNILARRRVLPPGELRCICAAMECYRRQRRQTPESKTILFPTLCHCRRASNNILLLVAEMKSSENRKKKTVQENKKCVFSSNVLREILWSCACSEVARWQRVLVVVCVWSWVGHCTTAVSQWRVVSRVGVSTPTDWLSNHLTTLICRVLPAGRRAAVANGNLCASLAVRGGHMTVWGRVASRQLTSTRSHMSPLSVGACSALGQWLRVCQSVSLHGQTSDYSRPSLIQ